MTTAVAMALLTLGVLSLTIYSKILSQEKLYTENLSSFVWAKFERDKAISVVFLMLGAFVGVFTLFTILGMTTTQSYLKILVFSTFAFLGVSWLCTWIIDDIFPEKMDQAKKSFPAWYTQRKHTLGVWQRASFVFLVLTVVSFLANV